MIDEARLRALLNRGFLLSQAVERWQARGIWVVSRADVAYPPRLKKRLKNDAPSVLYGCGLQDIMHARSIAIVGSRDVPDSLIEYTRRTASLVAGAGLTVVSGAARGVDRAAMNGALEAGGRAVGVLPGDLERAVMTREHRNLLLEERLVLVSPFDPSLGFTVAQAMQRNKVIYALAEAALVVNADFNRGGTWAGAVEQLKKYSVPLFVRSSGDPSDGLDALQQRGARPWPELEDADGIEEILDHGTSAGPEVGTASPEPASEPADASPHPQDYARLLFRDVESYVRSICAEARTAEHVASELGVSNKTANDWLKRVVADGVVEKRRGAGYVLAQQDTSIPPAHSEDYADLLYRNVKPYVQRICAKPREPRIIADELNISTTTLSRWLKRLVDERTLVKEKRPVRFVVAPQELPLD